MEGSYIRILDVTAACPFPVGWFALASHIPPQPFAPCLPARGKYVAAACRGLRRSYCPTRQQRISPLPNGVQAL
jgi:hypothetical protein